MQFQADTLALLDHCHSHVIIDKALQSALLVLENYIITRRCHGIQKQKDVLEDENEALRKQIQVLQGEVEKMKGTLNETSSRLCEVKKSKEHLEDDLSSVFQLYNMRNSECDNEREESVQDSILNSNKLQAEISTLVESNEKLTEELATKEQEKETLQCELTSVKVSNVTSLQVAFEMMIICFLLFVSSPEIIIVSQFLRGSKRVSATVIICSKVGARKKQTRAEALATQSILELLICMDRLC